MVFDQPLGMLYEKVDSIVEIINTQDKDISEFADMKKNVERENKIKIYSLDQPIDGTRSILVLPVIQWKTESGVQAAKLYAYTETSYRHIYPLSASENTYLLIGDTKGDGSCHFNYAYVIQIKNEALNLEYPAFGGRPYLNFCNGEFEYDEDQKILKYTLNDRFFENLDESLYLNDHYGKFKNDQESGKKIYDKIADDYYEKCEFELIFEEDFFIK
ncbi:MAG: hypothetical protein IPG07_05765 [Crocinitomicaceae bacterium]|nr:hypothetical protein [Crocinitomicaceae bacterium]